MPTCPAERPPPAPPRSVSHLSLYTIGLFIYLFIYYEIVHEVHDRQTYSKNNEISKSSTVTLSQYLATLSLEHVQQSFNDCDCNILFPICSKLSLFLSTAAITTMN